jgi:creatinine amidohydrolase
MKSLIAASLGLALTLAGSTFGGEARAASPPPVETPINPLWRAPKVKNYLPDMTWPEVEALLTRTDMVIIPVGALEEHGPQGPIGTDFYNGTAEAQLIAQQTDVLVAPIIMPGNSPYHMGFPGTITLSTETLEKVYFEAAQSLIAQGFHRFLFLNAHGGNAAMTRFVVDRINQETSAVAVDLGDAAAPFMKEARMDPAIRAEREPLPKVTGFDRHAGVDETSRSLYLNPGLVEMQAARPTTPLTLPPHLKAMLPAVTAGDPTANVLFLSEALKAKGTGKHTSTREMTPTGVWSEADITLASAARGKADIDASVAAAVQFITAWKAAQPLGAP